MSSSALFSGPSSTAVLTWGGHTTRASMKKSEGLEQVNPSSFRPSESILLKMDLTFLASYSHSTGCSLRLLSSTKTLTFSLIMILTGMKQPQPTISPPFSVWPHLLTGPRREAMALSRLVGAAIVAIFIILSCWSSEVRVLIFPQLWQMQRRMRSTRWTQPMLKTGAANLICPKCPWQSLLFPHVSQVWPGSPTPMRRSLTPPLTGQPPLQTAFSVISKMDIFSTSSWVSVVKRMQATLACRACDNGTNLPSLCIRRQSLITVDKLYELTSIFISSPPSQQLSRFSLSIPGPTSISMKRDEAEESSEEQFIKFNLQKMIIEAAPPAMKASNSHSQKAEDPPRSQPQEEEGSSSCSYPNFKFLSKHLLGSLKYQVFITLLTLYSLFSDDLRTAFFTRKVDMGFDVLSLVVMVIFLVEIVLSILVIEDYFLSFFFFLDIISTVSIIFDVNFISDLIFATSTSSSVAQLASQSKASRAATRAVRIVKLFRIFRIIKLYKNSEKAKEIKEQNKKRQLLKEKAESQPRNPLIVDAPVKENHNSQNLMMNEPKEDFKQVYPQEQLEAVEEENKEGNDGFDAEAIVEAEKKESKIGKVLSQKSIKKIIIVVLLMMFIIPLFSIDLYRDPGNAWDYLLVNQQDLLLQPNSTATTASISTLIQAQISHFLTEDNFIIQYTSPFNELPYLNSIDLSVLRDEDLLSSSQTIDTAAILAARPGLTLRASSSSTSDLTSLNVILDQNQYNRKLALFSLAKTFFICLILLILMHLFSKSIDSLLVEPIESMMGKLMLMAKDPQSAAKQELDSNIELETAIISNAIIKIGALLSTVFGSAGAEIIGSNIIEEGDMNPMIEGKKKCAIFGFCDIRSFTEITEVLQEEILIFVNKIGSLVHESVYRYGGSANKNIGEAFLLVWKIPEDKYALNTTTNHIDWLDRQYLSVLADFALLGFVKTLIKIHTDPLVLEYSQDTRLREVIQNFRVSMGFGLHVGWAIEGAIGSEYKIDASYLSPNVNMASRLEAATRQFGVDFLLSQDLYQLLTPEMKEFCRNIDRVTVKGSEKPIRLYTVDLCYERLSKPVPNHIKYPNGQTPPTAESKRAFNLEYLKEEEIPKYSARKFISEKREFSEAMVNSLPEPFKKSFNLGVQNYLEGKWGDARLHFSEALKYRKDDGPTKTLLNYMKKSNYIATDWKEYRPLTSK